MYSSLNFSDNINNKAITSSLIISDTILPNLVNKTRIANEFENKIRDIAKWFLKIPLNLQYEFIEKLLSFSEIIQIDLIWTILQPITHRDLYYAAKIDDPDYNYKKLSTPITRAFKKKRIYQRENSVYITNKLDAIKINEKYNTETININLKEFACFPKSSSLLKLPNIFNDNKKLIKDVKSNQLNQNIIDTFDKQKQKKVYFYDDDDLTISKKKCGIRTESEVIERSNINMITKWYEVDLIDLQKNIFIENIIRLLDKRQQYYLISILMPRKYQDFLSKLPENLSIKILGYLNSKDLENAQQVNKIWNKLANSDKLWKSKCEIKDSSYLFNNSNGLNWKDLYEKLKQIKLNWARSNFRVIEFKGHKNNVLCLKMKDNILATGSLDRTIKIWNIKLAKLDVTLKGHTNGVWCLEFITNLLLCSGSYDSTIKIWNLRNGFCLKTLTEHSGPVWQFVRKDTLLISVSHDKSVKIWDMNDFVVIKNLTGHSKAIFCVDICNNIIVTGSADYTVKVWDDQSGKCLKTLLLDNSITSVCIDGTNNSFFLACACNQKILLWKINKNKLNNYTEVKVQEFYEHYKRIESIKLKVTNLINDDGIITSGSQDGQIKLWDIKKKKSVATYDVHRKRINSVYFDDYSIVSASEDRTIKLLSFFN